MMRALMRAALDKASPDHKPKNRPEGEPDEGWLLADFGDVIVHIFSPDQRENYQLEQLWSKGKVLLHVQ